MTQEYFINKIQTAYLLDVDERTVTRWQNRQHDPLPVVSKRREGSANEYDPQALVKWHARQAVNKLTLNSEGVVIDYETERARLTKEQADAQAIKNEVSRNEVAPIALLEYALSAVCEEIKSVLGSIPLKVKNRCPELRAQAIEIIRTEIIKVQNAASKIRIKLPGEEEELKSSG